MPFALSSLLPLVLPLAPAHQDDLSTVVIESQPVRGNVHVLFGRGGNIGLCVGADGPFLVDDQFAPLSAKIVAKVAELAPGTDRDAVRFVVNTHWHGDHTGGNETLASAGAILVAHANVRERMGSEQFQQFFARATPPAPADALPALTFTEELTFHWNDETIRVVHVPHAHTDGDALIRFETADVLHTGDVFFHGMYPYVDLDSGGSIDGLVAAVERALGLCGEATRIIPGHGPLATPADLRGYRDMLATVRDGVAKLVAAGKSQAEIVAARPSAAFDERLGGGFVQPAAFVGFVAASLGARK